MNNRKYVIFNCSEISSINFNEVLETSANTLRKSVNKTKTFVKYEGEMPECIQNLQTKTAELTHEEIINILSTSEWTDPTQNL
jgi:hypothetical protein